jgi:hypothetical protein
MEKNEEERLANEEKLAVDRVLLGLSAIPDLIRGDMWIVKDLRTRLEKLEKEKEDKIKLDHKIARALAKHHSRNPIPHCETCIISYAYLELIDIIRTIFKELQPTPPFDKDLTRFLFIKEDIVNKCRKILTDIAD